MIYLWCLYHMAPKSKPLSKASATDDEVLFGGQAARDVHNIIVRSSGSPSSYQVLDLGGSWCRNNQQQGEGLEESQARFHSKGVRENG
jgi:hypothetical protein